MPINDYEAVWPVAADYYGVATDDASVLRNRDLRETLVGLAFIRAAHNAQIPTPFERDLVDVTARLIPSYARTRSFDGVSFDDVAFVTDWVSGDEDTRPGGAEMDWIHLGVLQGLADRGALPPPPGLTPEEGRRP